MSRTNPQQQASRAPRRQWRILAATAAGLLWQAVAVLWLGLALGYDFALVERYEQTGDETRLTGAEMAMRYGWPWPYLAAHKSRPLHRWHFWRGLEEVLWFSVAAVVADVALWLFLVSALGWLLFRWCRGRSPWQFHLGSFLVAVGIVALLFWPFVSAWHASGQAREVMQRLNRLDLSDAMAIRRLVEQDPVVRKRPGPGWPFPVIGSLVVYEERFLWFWTLLGMQTPEWAKVPVELSIVTFNPRQVLAQAKRIPTLRSIKMYVCDLSLLVGDPAPPAAASGGKEQPAGSKPQEAQARVEAKLKKHGLAIPPVTSADLKHLEELPHLQYLRLSLPQRLSREEVAVLARLPRLVFLFVEYPNGREASLSPEHLPVFLNAPRLRSLAVTMDHKAVPEEVQEQFRRRGIALSILVLAP